MAQKIDVQLSEEANLLALIKATKAADPKVQALEEADLVFGEVTVNETGLNTTLAIEAAASSDKVTGSTTINYTRLAPGAAVDAPVVSFTLAHDDDLATLVAQASAALGVDAAKLALDVEELVEGEQAVQLSVANSLLYVGSIELTVTVEAAPVVDPEVDDLGDLVSGDQDGFEGA